MPLRPRIPAPHRSVAAVALLVGTLVAVGATSARPDAAVAAGRRSTCAAAPRQDRTLVGRLAAHDHQAASLRAAADLADRAGRPAEARSLRVALARVELARAGTALDRARLADRCGPVPPAPLPVTAPPTSTGGVAIPPVGPTAVPATPVPSGPAPTTVPSTPPAATVATIPVATIPVATIPVATAAGATASTVRVTAGPDPCASTRRSAEQLARQAAALRTRSAQAQARAAAATARGSASAAPRESATAARLAAEATRIQAAADALVCPG